jgi:DNA recombination protein RmuC
MEYIFLITGILIGGIVGFLISILRHKKIHSVSLVEYQELDNNYNQLNTDKIVLEQKLEEFTRNINEYKSDIEKERTNNIELSKNISVKETELLNINEKLENQKKELEDIQSKFAIEFKNLANEIFEEKSKRFTDQNKTNITEILKPLNEKIKDFEKRVEETYDKESKERFSLQNEIKRLFELNQQLSSDANNLTKALKGESKTQGNWGEVILENILERSGLAKDREYFVQNSYTDEKGKRLQPDVIVTYPGERNVIIDSKVSLTAYERFVSTDDETQKESAFKEHQLSIKNHINELSLKNYQDIYQLNSLDFVMMFLPIEPAYLLAIEKDPELWNYAYEKRVLMISPTNLIAALKMIASLWRQEYQNRNAMEIAQKGGDLYDKFVSLLEDLTEVGKKLESTQTSYKASMNKLVEGKGNLVKRVEDIRKLGVKTKKNISPNILDRSADEE